MGVVDLFSRFWRSPQANSITTSEDLAKVLQQVLFSMQSSAGVQVNVDVGESVTAAYRAVKLLSDTLASLPFGLMRVEGDRRVLADSERVHTLLHDRPNELQTAWQFRAIMQRDLEWRGNAYALKVDGFRGVGSLIRLHPDHVEVREETPGEIIYRYTAPDRRQQVFAREQIMHLWAHSDDGIVGKSPIRAHRDTLGEQVAMLRHSSRFFSNGARPAGVLEVDQAAKIGNEAAAALREDFEKLYSGSENAWRTVVLPGGISYRPVTMSMDDAQFIETRKLGVGEIARIFGVPPHKVGDLERATFSNIEHQAIEFVMDAVTPRVRLWESCIHRDLLDNNPSLRPEFNTEPLLRGDAKSMAEALQIQRRNGVINANEWRALIGLNPRTDEGGDEYIVERNMTAKPDEAAATTAA